MSGSDKNDPGGHPEPPKGFEDELFSSEIHQILGELDDDGSHPVAAPVLEEPAEESKASAPAPGAAAIETRGYQSAERGSRWWLWLPLALLGLGAVGFAAWTFAIEPWIQKTVPGVEIEGVALSVDTVPPGAVVWLRLGQAPVTSPPVSAGKVHRLRIAHPSHPPQVVEVPPAAFGKKGAERRAVVRLKLPALDGRSAGPPPEPAAAAGGRGQIVVHTTPKRALVWLEIGTTPNARLTGLTRWHGRELLLELDGHAPEAVKVKPSHFGEDGRGHINARLEPVDRF